MEIISNKTGWYASHLCLQQLPSCSKFLQKPMHAPTVLSLPILQWVVASTCLEWSSHINGFISSYRGRDDRQMEILGLVVIQTVNSSVCQDMSFYAAASFVGRCSFPHVEASKVKAMWTPVSAKGGRQLVGTSVKCTSSTGKLKQIRKPNKRTLQILLLILINWEASCQ